MNVQKLKQYVFAIAMTLAFVIAPSFLNFSAVQADSKRDRDRRESRYDRDEHRYRDRYDDDKDERRRWRRRRGPRLSWCPHHRRYERFLDCYRFSRR